MPSIKDVAKHANVGIATVSRVLNNSGFVSSETRALVQESINTLGYVPNELARNFQKRRTNFIGIIVPSVKEKFTSLLLSQLEEDLSKLGYFVLLFVSNHNSDKEIEYLEKMKSQQVSGTIMTAPFVNFDMLAKYSDLPIVSFDRFLHKDIPCVHIDNYKASTQLSEMLLERCADDVVFIGFGADPESLSRHRQEAFEDVCKQNNRTYRIYDNIDLIHDREFLLDVYAQEKKCKGFFLASDTLAQVFINIIKPHTNIGSETFVVGFDGIEDNTLIRPKLTTASQNLQKISHALVSSLMQQINKEQCNEMDIVVEHSIQVGETC